MNEFIDSRANCVVINWASTLGKCRSSPVFRWFLSPQHCGILACSSISDTVSISSKPLPSLCEPVVYNCEMMPVTGSLGKKMKTAWVLKSHQPRLKFANFWFATVLGELCNSTQPQFSHLRNGNNNRDSLCVPSRNTHLFYLRLWWYFLHTCQVLL